MNWVGAGNEDPSGPCADGRGTAPVAPHNAALPFSGTEPLVSHTGTSAMATSLQEIPSDVVGTHADPTAEPAGKDLKGVHSGRDPLTGREHSPRAAV